MSDTIPAPALAEHPREDSKEAKLAAFAKLNLHSAKDIKNFIREQEAAFAAWTSMVRAD